MEREFPAARQMPCSRAQGNVCPIAGVGRLGWQFQQRLRMCLRASRAAESAAAQVAAVAREPETFHSGSRGLARWGESQCAAGRVRPGTTALGMRGPNQKKTSRTRACAQQLRHRAANPVLIAWGGTSSSAGLAGLAASTSAAQVATWKPCARRDCAANAASRLPAGWAVRIRHQVVRGNCRRSCLFWSSSSYQHQAQTPCETEMIERLLHAVFHSLCWIGASASDCVLPE